MTADGDARNVTPPVSLDAEQAVLGGLMLVPEKLSELSDWLPEEAFWPKKHQLLFRAITELQRTNQPCDAVTLGEWLEAQGIAQLVGGARYVVELANATPSAANIAAYAEIVVEKWKLRQALEAGNALCESALARGARSRDVANEALRTLSAIADEARLGGPVAGRTALKEWHADFCRKYEDGEKLTGVETPWREVNDLTLGWQPGELVVIAGRSNMGKSALAFQAAGFSALRGIRTGIWSLEMSRKQVVQRMVACFGEVAHLHLRKPKWLPEEHHRRVTAVMERLHDAPLVIDDQAGLTAAQIVMRAKREQMRAPLGLVLIDHLQDVIRPYRKGENASDEIGENVRQFKELAKALRCPVLLVSQLNRQSQQRQDHRPTLSDLRGSGDIEQKADLVLFAHREDYYDPDTHLKGVLELIVGKGRDMPTGQTIHLANRFDQMRAEDWSGLLPEKPKPERKARGLGGNVGADRAAGGRE